MHFHAESLTPKFLFEPMNEQLDQASQILTPFIESFYGALPDIFAGLVVFAPFLSPPPSPASCCAVWGRGSRPASVRW